MTSSWKEIFQIYYFALLYISVFVKDSRAGNASLDLFTINYGEIFLIFID